MKGSKEGRPSILRIATAVAVGLFFVSLGAAAPAKTDDADTRSPEEAVQERIALDARLEGSKIEVEFKDGTVTLSGELGSLGQKIIAEEDLYEVRGVNKVVNDLSVKPSDIPDEKIAKNILRAIPSHCLVETEGIKVDVENGKVTLTGTSEKLHHSDVIMSIAMFTRGVRSVDNQIRVLRTEEDKAEHTDERIRKNVEGVIESIVMVLQEKDIDIEVEQGEVTLTGKVSGYGNARKIARAVRNVPGVVKVTNRITPHVNYYQGYYY